MSVLEVRAVTKQFGSLVAVNAVDFALDEGEMQRALQAIEGLPTPALA